jgi:hypothetical protein
LAHRNPAHGACRGLIAGAPASCAGGAQDIAGVPAGALPGGYIRVGFYYNEFLPSGARVRDRRALVAMADKLLAQWKL